MTHPILRRALFSITLLCWGGVMLHFFVSLRLFAYLAPDFRPYVLAGGLGLVVVGLFNLLTLHHTAACDHDHGPGEDHEHAASGIHPLAVVAVLLIPLFLTVAWTRDAYSVAALTRKGLDEPASSDAGFALAPLTRELIEQQHPANSDGYRGFRLMELFFSAGDPEMRGLLEGLSVVTEGRLIRDPDGPPDRRRLYRLLVTCCAADSRAVPITARFEGPPPEVPDNTWMTLSGVIGYPDEGRGPVPVLEVSRAEATDAPLEESFLRRE